ncbi:hypothetical protein TD95_004042 [Thielaviopsis punctulata]|uniref:18S rRNA factor 2 n=1 Tax=Thielaviopsis punctulata TaxID=72032 RepID=A0A0F4ZFT2_9PEZI|nr:hypothetical protein TD95_004042 [Thielaviopsis punctulata]
MPEDKRNPLLDDLSDDDNAAASDSDADDLRKGASLKTKRRRDSDASDSDAAASDSDEDLRPKGKSKKAPAQPAEPDAESDGDEDENADADVTAGDKESSANAKAKAAAAKLPAAPKQLAKKNLIATEEAIKKSGVLYISRIPPFMKPHKLRTLLEPHGTINRTFLMPEDDAAHARRVRAGGNKKRLFTEGWVEFVSKKDAKRAYELLNARTIGGKKGSYYRDDVWSLVYLRGFKWRDLMAQISAENAERASRMQAEIAKAARENKEFVRNVERAKMLDGIKQSKEARAGASVAKRRKIRADGTADEDAGRTEREKMEKKEVRSFKQTAKVVKNVDAAQPASVSRVLSKIF